MKGFETIVHSNNGHIAAMETYIGKHNGNPILAVTDVMGPNVIYGNHKCPKHLLSAKLKTHSEAIELGARVLERGPKVHRRWKDMKEPIGAQKEVEKRALELMFEVATNQLTMGQEIFR